MSMDTHVNVTLRVNNSGVSRQGFGTIGVPSYRAAAFGAAKSLVFTQSADAVTGGFPADGPEALAISRILAQSPHVKNVKLLLCTRLPTISYQIDVSAVKNLVAYSANVKGEGVTASLAKYTSDANATNDEIATGVQAALDAVVGKNYATALIGGVGAKSVTVTGNAPGNFFTLELLDTSLLKITNTTVDPGIAADLADAVVNDPDFYYVGTWTPSAAIVTAQANWSEATPFKAFVPSVSDSDCENTAMPGAVDVIASVTALGLKRTLGPVYHRKPDQMIGFGIAGRVAPLTVGKWTLAYKAITGCSYDRFTATQLANLDAKKGSYYKLEGDRPIVWEGKVGSPDYLFFDVTVGLDRFLDDMQKSMFGVFVGQDKVFYDDADIEQIRAAGFGAIRRGIRDGYVAAGIPGSTDDPEPTLIFPTVAEIDPAVRALRKLPNGACSFRYNGAVHSVDVDVSVTF